MRETAKRAAGFDKQDWKHVRSLCVDLLVQCVRGNVYEVKEVYFLLKLHLTRGSTRVKD